MLELLSTVSLFLHKHRKNCILNAVYVSNETDMQGDNRDILWLSKLKNLLECNGFADVWYYPHSVDPNLFIPLLRRRLIDNFLVELQEGLNTYSSMTLYRELKDDFSLSEYLKISYKTKSIEMQFRNCACHLMSGYRKQ